MRTTVEITPEHRSALLELAARRGEKGFSGVLSEALESYLGAEKTREKLRRDFIALAGTMDAGDANELRDETGSIRAVWR